MTNPRGFPVHNAVVLHVTRTSLRKRLFTLVELLVVIAIISVLAGMLLPALRGALDAANGIKCNNNLKQMGLAMSFYTNDHRGFYPCIRQDGVTASTLNGYHLKMVADYAGITSMEAGILRCPAREKGPQMIYFAGDWGSTLYSSYGGSDFIFNDNPVHIRVENVKTPSTTLVYADAAGHTFNEWGQKFTVRHGGGFNMLMADNSTTQKQTPYPDGTTCAYVGYAPFQTNWRLAPWGGTHP